MTTIIPHRHALRRGTAAEWTADNPVLGNGEEGYETDTGLRKTGDGAAVWTALPYANRGPAGAPGSTDLTFADNGDNTGTLAWSAGASSAKVGLLAVGDVFPTSLIPAAAITIPTVVASQAAMLALTAQEGDVAIRSDNSTAYMLAANGDPTVLADWLQISQPGGVTSVNGQTGVIVLSAADVSAVPTSRTVAGHALTADVTLSDTDISGLGTAATVDTGTASGNVPLLGVGGVLPIARLATGTPNGAKFVRDDGTLAAPSASVSLSHLSGSLTSDVLLVSTNETTIFTISGLTIGTWLITVTMSANLGGGSAYPLAVRALLSSGSVGFSGATSAGGQAINGQSDVTVAMTFLAQCSQVSTVLIVGECAGGVPKIEANTKVGAYGSASGWTAVKIA